MTQHSRQPTRELATRSATDPTGTTDPGPVDTPSADQAAADDAGQPVTAAPANGTDLPTCDVAPAVAGISACRITDPAKVKAGIDAMLATPPTVVNNQSAAPQVKSLVQPQVKASKPKLPVVYREAPEWCSPDADQTYVNKRFEHCSETSFYVEARQLVDDGSYIVVGGVNVSIINYAYTQKNAQASIDQIEIGASDTWGRPIDVSGTGGSFNGTGFADVPIETMLDGMHYVNINRSDLATAPLAPGPNSIDQMTQYWELNFTSHGENQYVWESNDFGFRCDNALPGYAVAGCVATAEVPDVPSGRDDPIQPVFIINSGQNGGWSNDVLTGIYTGLPGGSKYDPLTRTTDQSIRDANNRAACPTARQHPRPVGYQCDEYPFASTLEGAASANAQAGGPRTLDGCDFDSDPRASYDYKSHIGWLRCMIPALDNQTGGGLTGGFYKKNRVLDQDKFYILGVSPV